MRTEDGYIIYKCLNDDTEAFGLLIDKYKAGVYALAYSKLRNFHDAEDVAQDTFIRAYESLHKLRRWDSFASWLYRIAVSLCKRRVRSHSRRPDRDFIEDREPDLLENHTMDSHNEELLFRSIHESLESLSEEYHQVLILHYFGGMTSAEIGRFVGMAPATIRRKLIAARTALKSEMLVAMGETFEEQKLSASFTLRILEATKHIRVKPLTKLTELPLGTAINAAILATILSLGTITGALHYTNRAKQELADLSDPGELPVELVEEIFSKREGDMSMLNRRQITFVSIITAILGILSGNALDVSAQTEWTKADGPVLDVGPSGSWDQNRVIRSVVLIDEDAVDEEIYKMWYSGGNGSLRRTGYATSPDGINWTKYNEDVNGNSDYVLPTGAPETWDDTCAWFPSVLIDDSLPIDHEERYKIWYTGVEGIYSERRTDTRIGYATSSDGINWTKYNQDENGNSDYVLPTGEPGSWDWRRVNSPSVLIDKSTTNEMERYKMWYEGDNGTTGCIGYATSPDGIEWTKHGKVYEGRPGEAVIHNGLLGPQGAWDSIAAGIPSVRQTEAGYEMWYYGYSYVLGTRIGYAISPDGIHWTKFNIDENGHSDYVLEIGESGDWDDQSVYCPSVLLEGNVYKMWYAGAGYGTAPRIGYATSIIPDYIPPIVSDIEVAPNPVAANNPVELTAIVDDSTTGSSNITSAEYRVEDNAGNIVIDWSDMMASDNAFDEVTEEVEGIITGLNMPGTYKVWVRGTDSVGNTGDGVSITLTVNPLPAVVDIDPDTLNLKSKGRWITCYIELPEGYNVNDIDVDTILLEGVMEVQRSNVQGDVLMVKFDRRELIDYLDGVTGYITLTVTGEVDGNIPFEGNDTIRVIKPGKAPVVPHEFALLQNYPNYFNPETWIPYRLAEGVDVSIKVFDISGRLVRSLNLGHRPAGFYVTKEKAAYWDGRNEAGEHVSSGVYFYRIQAGEYTATRKMIARK